MKINLLTTSALLLCLCGNAQTLTLVSPKRLYDHHSSSLSGSFYGDYNVNTKSGYDFVNHTNMAAAAPSLEANRDMVEQGGPFRWDNSNTNYSFGFTNDTSDIGGHKYTGNGQTKFYLNPTVTFSTLTP